MRHNQRDESFRVALNAAERRALQALAEDEGDTQSAVVRRWLRRAAKERGVWPPPGGVSSAPEQAVRP